MELNNIDRQILKVMGNSKKKMTCWSVMNGLAKIGTPLAHGTVERHMMNLALLELTDRVAETNPAGQKRTYWYLTTAGKTKR
jgi:repressor of nif and glnA expression